MPFVYRLQKILDFRIRKKEAQLLEVQKAQTALYQAEEDIRRNLAEVESTKENMRRCDYTMMEAYDKYLHHLWDKGEELEQVRQEKEEILRKEVLKLVELEQAVKVLEKHKEKNKEEYLKEQKNAELKNYSELGVQRYFQQTQEKMTEEEEALLKQLESEQNGN